MTDLLDTGADGPAAQARPVQVTRVSLRISAYRTTEREIRRYADTLLIDRLHAAAQITDDQHEVLCRLYALFVAAGLSPRSTARHAVLRETPEPVEDAIEGRDGSDDARTAYNTILRAVGAMHASPLASAMYDQFVPLVALRAATEALAEHWRHVKGP